MKTIMHVLNTGKHSGAEHVAIEIIEHFQGKYKQIYVSLNGPIENLLRDREIRYLGLDRLSVSQLKRAIKETQPELIHAHDYTAGIISALSTTKIPIINHLHNNSPWMKRYGRNSIVYFLSTFRYRKILTVSSAIQDDYVFGQQIRRKILNIGNPISTIKIQKTSDQAQSSMKSDITFLGRLSPEKNPLLFLDIVSDLKKLKQEIKVVMIGDGEMREDVEQRIKELKLTDTVKLTGYLSNPYGCLKETRLLCMPSEWEGFGLAAVEAMALGKPVICSGAGGLKDLVNCSCGSICSSREEYVSEIMSLLTDEDSYRRKSVGAFDAAKRLDNTETYFERLEQIYEDA